MPSATSEPHTACVKVRGQILGAGFFSLSPFLRLLMSCSFVSNSTSPRLLIQPFPQLTSACILNLRCLNVPASWFEQTLSPASPQRSSVLFPQKPLMALRLIFFGETGIANPSPRALSLPPSYKALRRRVQSSL